jgi:hypothetical protein
MWSAVISSNEKSSLQSTTLDAGIENIDRARAVQFSL